MDVDAYRAAFRGSPMKRAKLPAMKRNAAVVLGNVGTREDIDVLTRALDDPAPLERKHGACRSTTPQPRYGGQAAAGLGYGRTVHSRRDRPCGPATAPAHPRGEANGMRDPGRRRGRRASGATTCA